MPQLELKMMLVSLIHYPLTTGRAAVTFENDADVSVVTLESGLVYEVGFSK